MGRHSKKDMQELSIMKLELENEDGYMIRRPCLLEIMNNNKHSKLDLSSTIHIISHNEFVVSSYCQADIDQINSITVLLLDSRLSYISLSGRIKNDKSIRILKNGEFLYHCYFEGKNERVEKYINRIEKTHSKRGIKN